MSVSVVVRVTGADRFFMMFSQLFVGVCICCSCYHRAHLLSITACAGETDFFYITILIPGLHFMCGKPHAVGECAMVLYSLWFRNNHTSAEIV
jgi:hypothetical protein